MTAIILLNWNGGADTVACLSSLFRITSGSFVWMVVDNGSTDSSPWEIQAYLQTENRDFERVEEGGRLQRKPESGHGIFYSLKENYGFAKGNNLGIELLECFFSENGMQEEVPAYYLLLNNDTEVEPDFLEKLVSFADSHPDYVAFTPQIRYGEPSDRIWNCGGTMFWGFRKYKYGEKPYTKIREKDFIPVNLLTGCALFVRRELLGEPDEWLGHSLPDRYPRLLSERFFFGEEDFDFCLRMQKEKRKMACVTDSVIYHKQGSAQGKLQKEGRIYVHYLNRFIDVRQHWGKTFKYMIWKILYIPYIVLVFHRSGPKGWRESFGKTRMLIREAECREGVSKAMFLACLK